MERKFKVGDKVKFIDVGKKHSPMIKINEIGIIERINLTKNYYIISFSEKTDRNQCYENELELVQTTKTIEGNLPKQVIFNKVKGVTVLLWNDGDKTIVKIHEDKFDERMGFLIAFYQKYCGLTKNKANKYLDSLIPQTEATKEKEMFVTEEVDSFIVGEQFLNGDVEYAQMYSKTDYTIGQAVEKYYNECYSAKKIEEDPFADDPFIKEALEKSLENKSDEVKKTKSEKKDTDSFDGLDFDWFLKSIEPDTKEEK